MKLKKRYALTGVSFTLPFLAGFALLYLIPFLWSIQKTFTAGAGGIRFAGLQNYADLFRSAAFRLAAGNTFRFIAVGVPLLMALSFLLALALSFAGCALVSGIVGGDTSVSAVGLLLGVGAGFCYATYTIFAHYGLAHYDSYTMIYWTFLVAGIGSLFFLNPTELAAAMPDSRLWLGTAGLVLIATVLPYIFYTKGLEGVESGKASIIANVEPVVAALTGVVFFHETLSIWTLLGVACVLGGVILLAKGDDTCKESHSSTAST